MVPATEFRTLAVTLPAPEDRTAEGTVVGTGDTLDLGEVNTTDEAQETQVKVLWWRVTNMNGNTEISNIRVWISDTDGYVGATAWYLDVTDTWTPGKTAVQVMTGTPGAAPLSEPSANVTKMNGGTITETTHDQTSQYIYLTGTVGVNETIGEKSGPTVTVKFDYH